MTDGDNYPFHVLLLLLFPSCFYGLFAMSSCYLFSSSVPDVAKVNSFQGLLIVVMDDQGIKFRCLSSEKLIKIYHFQLQGREINYQV